MGTLHFTSHICEKMQDKQQFYSFQTLQQLTQGVPKICFLSRTIEDPAFLHSNLPPPIWWTDKVTWFSILCQPRTNTPCVAQPWNHSYLPDQDTKILKRCVRRDEMKGGEAFLKEAQFFGEWTRTPSPHDPPPPPWQFSPVCLQSPCVHWSTHYNALFSDTRPRFLRLLSPIKISQMLPS